MIFGLIERLHRNQQGCQPYKKQRFRGNFEVSKKQ